MGDGLALQPVTGERDKHPSGRHFTGTEPPELGIVHPAVEKLLFTLIPRRSTTTEIALSDGVVRHRASISPVTW